MEQDRFEEALAETQAAIEAHGGSEFVPFAYYDKSLDCIRVRVRDCVMKETRMSRIFTMVFDAYNPHEAVGFNIKGVRHLFEEIGLATKGVHRLTEIIDAIVRKYPDAVIDEVKRRFSPIIEDENLEVEVDSAA